MNDSNRQGVTVIPVYRSLIITLPGDLGFGLIDVIRDRVFEGLKAHSAKLLILECSGVQYMDCEEFGKLRGIADVARLNGLETCLVGINPWVAGYLGSQGVNLAGFHTRRGLEEALEIRDGS